jgi:tetratricopeptide (TPR) repeat protein
MNSRVAIVIATLLCLPSTGIAHHNADDLSKSVLIELKSVAAQLKFARHRLERLLSTRGSLSQEILAEAQNAYYEERPGRATQLLVDLLARADFVGHPGRPEALLWLGEALLKLGFHRSATAAFAESVSFPKQTLTSFEHRLRRLLEESDGTVTVDALDVAWKRYSGLRELGHPAFSEMRYLAARTLYRSGGYQEAERVFLTVVPDDPEFVRSQYFLGVIHLRRGEVVDAKRVFTVALEAWTAANPPAESESYDVSVRGERRTVAVTSVEDIPAALRERQKIGFALHLTMARLAAHGGDLRAALRHYRRVPPGAEQHEAAVRETIHILSQSSEFTWAARTMAGTLPREFQSSRQFLRALEYSRLLAKGERYQEADKMFTRVADQVARAERNVLTWAADTRKQKGAAEWLFPKQAEAWVEVISSPEVLASLIQQTKDLLQELVSLGVQEEGLPVVQQGMRLQKQVQSRLTKVRADVTKLAGLDGADLGQAERMFTSIGRLHGRLLRFDKRIQHYRAAYAQRLSGLLRAESAAIVDLERRLGLHGRAVALHQKGLTPVLRKRLAAHDTGAVLGQVNIAYWRKEAVSERIERLILQQRTELRPTETFPVEPSDPIGPAEVSTIFKDRAAQESQPDSSRVVR